MTDMPIIPPAIPLPVFQPLQKSLEKPPDLHSGWQQRKQLPALVRESATIMRCLELLAPLDWAHLPERDLQRNWGQTTIPYAAFIAAELIRLNEGLHAAGDLHQCLLEHPGFIWLLNFPLHADPQSPAGFNARASLPTARHFTRMQRQMPNAVLQCVLADSVQLILSELAARGGTAVDCVSLDTKHILAWVKENNPKAYVTDRFNKDKQPMGDPDCKLGCKRRHNQVRRSTTPTRNPVAADTVAVGEYYWGYGSGLVVTKVPHWGEFVIAERTQPFDQADVSYFFPLMRQVEHRLGYRPRIGTFDAAFDAWYVHAYFYRENDPVGSFAAVPFAEKGGYQANGRQFSPEGLPICAAGLAMPLQFTYTDRTTCLLEHERGKYVCPLLFPTPTARACPIRHPNWKKGGCTAMMPTSIGARLRYTLDRDGAAYKDAYRQRTAVERINSQAVALGIERPHLRNRAAIANQNTLIYTLINLRFLQRLRAQPTETDSIGNVLV